MYVDAFCHLLNKRILYCTLTFNACVLAFSTVSKGLHMPRLLFVTSTRRWALDSVQTYVCHSIS